MKNCVPSKSRTYFRTQKRPEVESKSDTSQERLESNLFINNSIKKNNVVTKQKKKRKGKHSIRTGTKRTE